MYGDKSNPPDLGDDPLPPELAEELENEDEVDEGEGREMNGEGECQGATGGDGDTMLSDQINSLELSEQVCQFVEGLYYLCSENKGADQLRGYREADLRLCFRICKMLYILYTQTDTRNEISHSSCQTSKQGNRDTVIKGWSLVVF